MLLNVEPVTLTVAFVDPSASKLMVRPFEATSAAHWTIATDCHDEPEPSIATKGAAGISAARVVPGPKAMSAVTAASAATTVRFTTQTLCPDMARVHSLNHK